MRIYPTPGATGSDISKQSACIGLLVIGKRLRAAFLCAMACLYPGTAQAERHQVYFAAPYSGEKVTHYAIELPVSKDHRQSFEIPEQCSDVTQAAIAGASRWGTRQERSVWQKVDRDCRYHAFLNRYDGRPAKDYISGFDIWNAPLCDLLIESRCSNPDALPGDPDCQPLPPGIPRISQLLNFAGNNVGEALQHAEPCRLDGGIFRGWVVADPAGTHCIPDPNAPGFRLMSVDYADVNGDGMLDVVLRLVPLAPGASRIPLILPLTRTAPEGELHVPKAVSMPSD